MESTGIFQFADRTLCPKNRLLRSAYYSVYGVNLFTILNRNDYLYLKVADLVMCLALQQQNALIRQIKCK